MTERPRERPFPGGPRIVGAPLDYQDGDDRIQRNESGAVVISYGWFRPDNVLLRQKNIDRATKALADDIAKSPKLQRLLGTRTP